MCSDDGVADGAIRISGLTKDYGSGHGLFDLDLAVAEGEIFGYLGPNGSGKSTTIRLLMGMIRPTRGTATVFGLDSQREAVAVKRLVGYVPGELPQFGGLRGAEIVGFFAGRRPALAGALAVFAAALLSGVVSYLTRSSYANDLGSLLQYELQLVVSVVPYAVAGALSGLLGGRLRAGLSGIPAGR